MEKIVNYISIVVIVIILAYFFKGPFYKIIAFLKNIVNVSLPRFDFIYI